MMSLAELAALLEGRLLGADARFTGVSHDTRTLAPGELYVALAGERFDGHDFLPQARARGAAGALVARALETTLPRVQVPDTRAALGRLAAHWRARFSLPLVAVTGSNGKTTVKEMIGAILGARGRGCVTRGNLNNDIGVPLTLLRLREGDRFAVIEMGMNHAGEIRCLAGLAAPTVALVTNAAEAHLAGLGSVEAVARAKGEIYEGLAPDGVAVINADDAHADLWRRLAAPRRLVTFGLERAADVMAEYRLDATGSDVRLHGAWGEAALRLRLLGRHNVGNALAAAAAALAAGADPDALARGLEQVRPVPGRLETRAGIRGARVIDDTYNANPASLAAALDVLARLPGERVLVLGDMAELGPGAAAFHREAGRRARTAGVARLYALGDLAAEAAASFGAGARRFDAHAPLIDALGQELHREATVLVKGSRVMRMDRVVAGLVPPAAAGAGEA